MTQYYFKINVCCGILGTQIDESIFFGQLLSIVTSQILYFQQDDDSNISVRQINTAHLSNVKGSTIKSIENGGDHAEGEKLRNYYIMLQYVVSLSLIICAVCQFLFLFLFCIDIHIFVKLLCIIILGYGMVNNHTIKIASLFSMFENIIRCAPQNKYLYSFILIQVVAYWELF